MCGQPYARCRNTNCKGFAVLLPVIPCQNAPNCEVQQIFVPVKDRPSVYCPNCQQCTKKERKSQIAKVWRAHKLATANPPPQGNTHMTGVEQQAQSSSQIPIDPALLEIDAISPKGIDTVDKIKKAEDIIGAKQAGSE